MVRHHLPLQGCYHRDYRGDGHSEWLAVGSVKEHVAGYEDEDPLPSIPPMNSTNTPDTASEDEPSSSSTPKTKVMILEEDAGSLIAEEVWKSKVATLRIEMYQVGMDVSTMRIRKTPSTPSPKPRSLTPHGHDPRRGRSRRG